MLNVSEKNERNLLTKDQQIESSRNFSFSCHKSLTTTETGDLQNKISNEETIFFIPDG